MYPLELYQALLSATYNHVGGDVLTESLDSTLNGPLASAQDFVNALTYAMDPVYFNLETSTGEVSGFCMHFLDKAAARIEAERLAPSLIILGDTPENQSVHLVYLVEGQADAIHDIVSELNLEETEDFYVDTTFPVPHAPYRLSDDDEAFLGQGQDDVALYSVAEVLDALWDDTPATVTDLDHVHADKAPKAKAAKPAKAKVESREITTLNDAEIHGEIPDDVLNLMVKISTGASQEEKIWKTTPEFSFHDLLKTTLSVHKEGKKNGQCFVTGAVAEKKRNKNSVLGMYLMGLDVDSGASLEETFASVQAMGLCAVFYTTHSHMSTELRVKQDRFYKWCENNDVDPEADTENVQAFLRDENKYNRKVIDSAEFVETIHDGTGMHLVIRTIPIPKFRIIFPLATPYIIADQKMAQRDAIQKWERMVMGMGASLNISIDRAARDPSRLFFLPRHAKGREYKILVSGGKALDWNTITEVDTNKQVRIEEDDPFSAAANVMSGQVQGRAVSPISGIDMMTWAAQRADGFEISSVFRDYCDDRLREETAPGKYTCECPFDDDHSNAGDSDDKGCFIQDAGAYADTFLFRCSHDSCSGRDRLQMMVQAMKLGWFPDSVLTDDAYDCLDRSEEKDESDEPPPLDEEPEKKKEDWLAKQEQAKKMIAKLKEFDDPAKIDEIFTLIVPIPPFSRDPLINQVIKQTKMNSGMLKSMFKQIEIRETRNSVVDDEVYDASKVSDNAKRRFRSLRASKKPVVVIDDAYEIATVNHAVKSLSEANCGRPQQVIQTRSGVETIPALEGRHFLFRYAGEKVRIVRQEDGTYRPDQLNEKNIASVCKDYLDVIKLTDAQAYTHIILPDWASRMIVADPALGVLPLDGFASMPYYTADKELVRKSGYDENARKILRMPDDVEARLGNPDHKMINMSPTKEEIDQAWSDLFEYVFVDFPFYDGEDIPHGRSSKAHLLAMMLHPLVRDMVDGPAPMYLVDKPSAGTGASLAVGTAMQIALGETIGTSALSENEDEIRKQISSNISAGKRVTFWDNVNYKLTSAFFANLATAPVWEDRILGRSEIMSIENNMQVIFAGNNVETSEENARRMLLVKLDFKDDPTSSDRKFVVDNLEQYVKEHRLDLFCMLLSFVNYWISKGAPMWEGQPLTGFENYCRVMGGILQTCGVEGFLENRTLMAGANNPDKLAWAGFIQEIISKIGFDKQASMADIVYTYCQMDNQPVLYVNGGGRVSPSEDESRTYAPMQRVIEKQLNQVFRVYVKGVETKVTIKKEIDREKSASVYKIVLVDDKAKAA